MRTKNSIKNVSVSIAMSITTFLVGFIFQKAFVVMMGTEYLGLNGLFTNILSILCVTELGFGSAIVYNLYKPLADNEHKIVISLITFYKKIYLIIATIILILGITMVPFIPIIVGNTIIKHVRLLFFISLIDIVASYLLTYKRSILYADQKNYVINIIHIIYIIVFNTLSILILYLTHNYILFLLFKIICRVCENVAINIYVTKNYDYITMKGEKVPKEVKKDIFTKVKGLLFHNLGSAVVMGTDNIIISKMFGLITVGLYSNYYVIINSITNLITQFFQSITASVGNLLIENDSEKNYLVYKRILFVNSIIYCIITAGLLSGINTFVEVWMGKEYLLSIDIIIVLLVNFYIQGMRKTNSVFKNAAGIFYEDRMIPIVEAVLNIVFSIVLGKIWGLKGIFAGTIISAAAQFLYSYPILVYKKLFDRKYKNFIIDNFKYFITDFIIVAVSFIITTKISVGNIFLSLIIKEICTLLVCIIILIPLYCKKDEYKYYVNLFTSKLKKIKKNKI